MLLTWQEARFGETCGGVYLITNITSGSRYVGSAVNLRRRWADHWRRLNRGIHDNTHLQNAFDCYGADAFNLRVLEYVERLEDRTAFLNLLKDREQHYIDTVGPEYNISQTAAHPGHIPHTPERRARMSLLRKGVPLPLEWRQNLSIAKQGRPLTDAQRAALSEVRRGKPKSAEHKAAIAAAKQGKPKSPEHRAKLSAATRKHVAEHPEARERHAHLRGKRLSDEHRQKIADAGRKRVFSAETRAKISARLRGNRVISPEQRAKMVAGLRRRVERLRSQQPPSSLDQLPLF